MRGEGILKSTTLVLILIGALFSLVSCAGVSQAELDRVSKDLDAARAHEQKISNDLAVTRSKIKDIETELDDARLRAEEARLVLEVLNEFINIGLTGDMSNVIQLFGKLDAIENQEIRQSAEYLIEYGDSISEDEAGMIILGWLEEVERMLK